MDTWLSRKVIVPVTSHTSHVKLNIFFLTILARDFVTSSYSNLRTVDSSLLCHHKQRQGRKQDFFTRSYSHCEVSTTMKAKEVETDFGAHGQPRL